MLAHKTRPARALLFPLALLLASCSSAPQPVAEKKAAEPKPPAAPVTGLSAIYKMYVSGRTWAADLEPLEVTSIPVAEVPAKDGEYGAWRAVFASESKKATKVYSFSLVEKGEQLHEGVFGAPEEALTSSASNVPFPMAAARIDTPAALKTALEKGGGAAFQAKNPKLPVMFKLIRDRKSASPTWIVYWGASDLNSPFAVYINADSGDYIKTVR